MGVPHKVYIIVGLKFPLEGDQVVQQQQKRAVERVTLKLPVKTNVVRLVMQSEHHNIKGMKLNTVNGLLMDYSNTKYIEEITF